MHARSDKLLTQLNRCDHTLNINALTINIKWLGFTSCAGKRLKEGETFVKSDRTVWILLIAAVVTEPLRFLTMWFLGRRSHYRRTSAGVDCSPLMDFVSPRTSPITRILQYYAACMKGTAPRLRLIWGRKNFRSFDQWAASPVNSECLRALRRAISCAASWVHVRFVTEGCGWPWRAVMIADRRIGIGTRQAIAGELFDGPDEKLDYYFCRRLRAMLTTADNLFEDIFQDAIQQWGWAVRLGISDTEYVHGRNHRRAHAGMTWSSFAAQHLNAEARLAHEASAKQSETRSLVVSSKPKYVRKRTALDEYRFEWYAEQRAMGRRINPAKAEVWGEVRSLFDALPIEDKQSYDVRARASPTAKEGRARCPRAKVPNTLN